MTTAPSHTSGVSGQRASADAEALLPRAPGVFRRWIAAHPNAVDWIIVGSYLFGCGLMLVTDFTSGSGFSNGPGSGAEGGFGRIPFAEYLRWPWGLLIACVVAVTATALKFRRRYPVAGVAIVSVMLFVEQGLFVIPNSVAVYFLLYAIPLYRNARAGWIGYAIAVVSSTALLYLTDGVNSGIITPGGLAMSSNPPTMSNYSGVGVLNAVWLLVVLLVGINFGSRRRYVEALIVRAHQLVREREQQGQLAAAAERSRIAREMHDVVAHSLSVVVTLSEAASVAIESKPVAAQHAMQRAAETGRSALVEMRRLLGVLADGGLSDGIGGVSVSDSEHATGFAPQPGIAQIAELVAGFAEAGLRIRFAERGSARGDAAQQLASYRIIQEGLTNSLRYAGPGAHVELTLHHAVDATEITMIDSGGPKAADVGDGFDANIDVNDDGNDSVQTSRYSIPGTGRGLTGMQQRAQIFGGSVEFGPYRGGWRISARIPITTALEKGRGQ